MSASPPSEPVHFPHLHAILPFPSFAMNPTRPPLPPHPSRIHSNDAMPNPFYSMHVNAAVAHAHAAGPSNQHVHPRSNSSPSSFYPPHLAQKPRPPQPPPLLPKPPSLASPLPPSLMPGSAGRSRTGVLSSLESTLFFQSSTTPLGSPTTSPTFTTPHPYAQSASPPSKPAIPSKPLLKTHTSLASLGEHTTTAKSFPETFRVPIAPAKPTTTPQSPASPTDYENELVARALELSLQDSGPTGHSGLEDDILARVLEESLASIDTSAVQETRTRAGSSLPRQLEIRSSVDPPSASSPSASSSSPSFVDTPATLSYSSDFNGSDAKKLHRSSASLDLEVLVKEEQELQREADELRRKQLEMDEEFARSIALLEASKASSSSVHLPASSGISSSAHATPSSDIASEPPSYSAALNCVRPSSAQVAPSTKQRSPPLHNSVLPRPLPDPKAPLSRSYGSYTAAGSSNPSVPSIERLGRSTSAQAAIPSPTESTATSSSTVIARPSILPRNTQPNSVIPVQHVSDLGSPDGSTSTPKGRPKLGLDGLNKTLTAVQTRVPSPHEEVEEHDVTRDELSPILSPVSALEPEPGRMVSNVGRSSVLIVEEELLMGVSFGFNAPLMGPIYEPMQGPIPNVITLPYGKCPPLHIQAPNWKHLLKLLTRLSDSRIEPTVEALAGTKLDLKLRTVIQFMKVHHSSEDWRTIVYLTIDTPIPPTTPNIFKYTNGDVTVLPYSYTNSPVPGLLRAGAGDSNLSKCFTVPSTVNTPYPTLPMSLPDFAMYLHAILEDSRRAMNDTSGGLRKLAKMVDSLYPAAADALDGIGTEPLGPDRRGVGGFFRRALGRGNRDTQAQRGGNAERFEFITPFRIDEYR